MIRIGTQGWNYDAWRGPFYPRDARAEDFLELYARVFDTVEVDSTFYAPPTENAVRGWVRRTPEDFTFSLKLPRRITHENRLRNSREDLEAFVARARLLGRKLACVLVQLPPDFSPRQFGALEEFLPLLPGDVRFAVELRDPAWMVPETLDLLREFDTALALVDGEWVPRAVTLDLASRPTAPFAYVRWLGPRSLTDYTRIQIDRERELARWARAFEAIAGSAEMVVGYFNNHFQGHSPASANRFKELIGQQPIDPGTLVKQPSLF
jgi:uncharacterized protein YecE (DUF72 family)